MATVKYLRKIPQRRGLTGMGMRTAVEEEVSSRSGGVPLIPKNPPASGLNAILEKPKVPVISNFNDLAEDAGPGGAVAPDAPVGGMTGATMGNAVAGSLAGWGAKGAVTTGITGMAMNAPTDVIAQAALMSSIANALNPVNVANITAGGLTALGIGQSAAESASGGMAPALGDIAEGSVADAALADAVAANLGKGGILGIGAKGAASLFGAPSPAQAAKDAYATNPAMIAETSHKQGTQYNAPLGVGGKGLGLEGLATVASDISSQQGATLAQAATVAANTAIQGALGTPGSSGNVGTGVAPGSMGIAEAGDAGAAPGGTVICTELYRQGIMPKEIYDADVRYADTFPKDVLEGYYVIGKPIARLMRRSKLVTLIIRYPGMAWAEYMAFRDGTLDKPNRLGRVIEKIGVPVCKAISNRNRVRCILLQSIQATTRGIIGL